ncbi:MAG: NAD(P)/FAD-dependent oxidoreductase [Exilispira sp.]
MQIIIRFYLNNKIKPDDQLDLIIHRKNITNYCIIKKSIDARKKDKIVAEYHLNLSDDNKEKLLNIDKTEIKRLKIQSIKRIYDEKRIFNIIEYNSSLLDVKNNENDKAKDVHKKIDSTIKFDLNSIKKKLIKKPVIIGFGPSSIFATFAFLEKNIFPVIIEMGEKVDEREITIKNYFNDMIFNPYSNVNFGEGGAGTFSDGKLYTRSRDEVNQKIFHIFHYFGAPKSILYDAYPHIGSDNLLKVISNIREFFKEKGVEFYFNTKLIDIEENKDDRSSGRWSLKLLKIEKEFNQSKNYEKKLAKGQNIEKDIFKISTDIIILATGHSCKEIYKILYKLGAKIEPKPFALGFRVEHPKELIDKNQYGKYYKVLPSANYKLLYKGRFSTIYSFCMCPGGIILPSNSEEDEIVTNGASKYLRDGNNSNSAIVCSISNDLALNFIKSISLNFDKILNKFLLKDFELLSFNKIKNTIEFELGVINKNRIFIKENSRKTNIEIENEDKKNRLKYENWEINLIFQQIFEKLPYYIFKQLDYQNKKLNKYFAPFQNISDFYISEHNKYSNTPGIDSTYPFKLYNANILKLFPFEIEEDFKDAFKYFNKLIDGFIENGIAIGYETRTSSAVKVVRDSYGQILDGIYMIGEGSGYCGGITTSAADGYKIASQLAKKLI